MSRSWAGAGQRRPPTLAREQIKMPSTRQQTPTAMNVACATGMVTRSMTKRMASEQSSATQASSASTRILRQRSVPMGRAETARRQPAEVPFGSDKRKPSDMSHGCPSTTRQATGNRAKMRPTSRIQSSRSSATSTEATRIQNHCDRYGHNRNGATTLHSAANASSHTKTEAIDDHTGTFRSTKAQRATTGIEDEGRRLERSKGIPRSAHFQRLAGDEPYSNQSGGRRARRCLFPNTPVEGGEKTGEERPYGKFIEADVLTSPRPTMTQERSKGRRGAGDGGRRRQIHDESRASQEKESQPSGYSHLSNSFCVFL